jgi:hypothetical protein
MYLFRSMEDVKMRVTEPNYYSDLDINLRLLFIDMFYMQFQFLHQILHLSNVITYYLESSQKYKLIHITNIAVTFRQSVFALHQS